MRSKPIVNCTHNSNQSRICGICWIPLKMKKNWIGGEFVWMPLHSKAAYDIRATQISILIDQVYGEEYPFRYNNCYPSHICGACYKKLIVTNVDDKGESSITAPVLKYTNADIKRLVKAPSMETHLYSSKGNASSCFVCTPFEEFWHANKNFKDAFIKKMQNERPKDILLKICVRCKLPKRKNHRCDRTSKETTEFVNKRMAPRQVALCLTLQLPPGKHELSLPTHGKPRRILTNPLVVRKAPHTIDDMIEFERDECFSKEQARRVSTRIRKSLANVSNHDGPARSAVEDVIYKRGGSGELYESEKIMVKVNAHKKDDTEKRKRILTDRRYNKRTDEIELPIFYCKDTIKLVRMVCEHRTWKLGADKIWGKVGIDAGKGILKAHLQLNNDSENYVSNSPKTAQVFFVVEDIAPESNQMMKMILEKLRYDELTLLMDVVIAPDLKVVNVLCGLANHSSAHCCFLCTKRITVNDKWKRYETEDSTYRTLEHWQARFEKVDEGIPHNQNFSVEQRMPNEKLAENIHLKVIMPSLHSFSSSVNTI